MQQTADSAVDRWLSTSEAGERIGVGTGRVIQLCREGALAHQQLPIGRIIREADVQALVARRRVQAEHDSRVKLPEDSGLEDEERAVIWPPGRLLP